MLSQFTLNKNKEVMGQNIVAIEKMQLKTAHLSFFCLSGSQKQKNGNFFIAQYESASRDESNEPFPTFLL